VVHAAVTPAQAELIMKKSGLWDQLGSVLPQARIGFSAAFSLSEHEPTNEQADALTAALEQAYGPDALRKLGLTKVSRSLDGKQVSAMLRWFDSPLGRKIDKVEHEAAKRQTVLREVMKEGLNVFEQLPPARRALLQKLLKETRADEAMVEVSLHTMVATHKGVSTAMPGGSTLTNDEVKAALTSDREGMIKAYAQLILASFAQAYEPLSDTELQSYVDFLHSSVGRRHTRLAYGALQAALEDGAARFVKLAPAALKAVAARPAAPAASAASTASASAP
jgi:hypothetical protein